MLSTKSKSRAARGRLNHLVWLWLFLLALPGILTAGEQAPVDSVDLLNIKVTPVYIQDFLKCEPGKPPANAWDNSKWAGGKVDMQVVVTGDPLRARAVECRVTNYGQICIGNFHLKKDKLYRVSLDVAAKGGADLTILLRQLPGPWKCFLQSEEKVTDDYRRISFLGKVTEDGDQVGLIITNRGRLSMRLANIKVEEVEGDVTVEAPPVLGNLVLNGSFELAGDGLYVRSAGSPSRPKYVRVPDAADGSYVAEIYDKNLVSTTWMRLSYQAEYLVRARVRAVTTAGKFNLSLAGSGMGWQGQTVDLLPAGGWKSVSFKVRPKPPASGKLLRYSDAFVCMSVTKGPVQVDAVEVLALIPGSNVEAQGYQPHAPLELAVAVDPGLPMAVATVGEPVPVKVLASADITAARLQVLDERGLVLETKTLKFHERQASLVLSGLPPGYLCLRTAPVKGEAKAPRVEGESFVCVVPVMPDVSLDKWIYGTHIVDYPPLRQASWKLGLHWDRLHDTGHLLKWDQVQPKGKDDWTFPDAWVAARRKDGFALLANLDCMPPWVPHKSAPVVPRYFSQMKVFNEESLPFWEAYTRQVPAHYKGMIDYYEVSNEPHISGTTAAEYVQALQVAYRGIKAGNPQARVVGLGGMVAGDSLINEVLKLGAGKYCDAISIHGYNLSTWATVDGPETLQKSVRSLRDLLKSNGAAEDMPIWDSETGWASPWSYTKFYAGAQSGDSPLSYARMFPKSVAGAKAAGLARVMYYAMFGDDYAEDTHKFRVCNMNDTMRMPLQPMAVAIATLEGREFVRQDMDARKQGIVHLVFEGRGATVHMMWTISGTQSVACSPNAKQVINMWGREIKPAKGSLSLSPDPVYIVE